MGMIVMTGSGTPLAAQVTDSALTLAKAVTAAMGGAAEGAKQELRKSLQASPYKFGNAVNAIRSDVYPRPPAFSPAAAATVYAAGDSADRFLAAFANGVVITPNRKRALAVPLHDFRGFDRRLIGPNSSFFGGKLVFIPAKNLNGVTIGVLASKVDSYTTGPRWSRNSRARRFYSKQIADNLISQFVLMAWVALPKIISPDDVMNAWSDRLPDLTEQALGALGVN